MPQLDEFNKFTQELPGELLGCQASNNHWWREKDDEQQTPEGYRVSSICQRCTTAKFVEYDFDNFWIRTTYRYPEGYQAPPGTGWRTAEHRAMLRGEARRRRGAQVRRPPRRSSGSRKLKVA